MRLFSVFITTFFASLGSATPAPDNQALTDFFASLGSLAPAPDNQAHVEDVAGALLAELSASSGEGRNQDRFERLEDAIRPTYASLPKNEHGNLNHEAMRYALHRLFLQQHGWFVRGLEPSAEKSASSADVLKGMMKENVPAYVQGLLEKMIGDRGLSLHDLAVVAVTLEDLIHNESVQRLEKVYDMHGFKKGPEGLLQSEEVENVINTFMTIYITGSNWTTVTMAKLANTKKSLAQMSNVWPKTQEWLKKVQHNMTEASSELKLHDPKHGLGFATTERIIEEVVGQFGPFNDLECMELKDVLVKMEDTPGRVRLSDFYEKEKHGYWEFDDKIEYLRSQGVLDESNPELPRVIMTNYIGSWAQCLKASGMYAVCCRNECEDLMGQLERRFAGPTATPARIIDFVAKLSSQSVAAPRALPQTLIKRLNEVAASNGGQVPLHGRLFAQWMSHAYPRECPYPHEAGTSNPQTPDQWMEATAQESTKVSKEEKKRTLTAAEKHPRKAVKSAAAKSRGVDEHEELPWTEAEELLVIRPVLQDKKASRNNGMSFWELVFICLGLAGLWRAKEVWSGVARSKASTSAAFDKCCV